MLGHDRNGRKVSLREGLEHVQELLLGGQAFMPGREGRAIVSHY
jgi:hypothetical protein